MSKILSLATFGFIVLFLGTLFGCETLMYETKPDGKPIAIEPLDLDIRASCEGMSSSSEADLNVKVMIQSKGAAAKSFNIDSFFLVSQDDQHYEASHWAYNTGDRNVLASFADNGNWPFKGCTGLCSGPGDKNGFALQTGEMAFVSVVFKERKILPYRFQIKEVSSSKTVFSIDCVPSKMGFL